VKLDLQLYKKQEKNREPVSTKIDVPIENTNFFSIYRVISVNLINIVFTLLMKIYRKIHS